MTYIPKTGLLVCSNFFAAIYIHKGVIFACPDANNKIWGIINAKGEYIVEPIFDNIVNDDNKDYLFYHNY